MVKSIDRLMEYLKIKGFKSTHFEKSIGVGNGYLSKTASRQSAIGSDVIEKIAENHKDLSIEWLITGVGYMIKDEGILNISDLNKCKKENKELKELLADKDLKLKRLTKTKSIPIEVINEHEFSVNEPQTKK